MAVSIHGNNGVITTNGTAAAPSFAAPDNDTGLYFGTNLIYASTSGSTRLTIDSIGRLGIGDENPTVAVSIKHTAPKIKFIDSDATGTPEILLDGSGGDLILDIDKDDEKGSTLFAVKLDGSEKLRISGSAGDLQLQGGKIYGDDASTGTFTLQNTSANSNHARIEIGAIQSSDNGGIHFYTAGSSAATRYMTLKGGGNLGIGIDNPTSRLYVNGVSTSDIITARAADTNGGSAINILAEGTTGISRIKFSDTAAPTGDGWISYYHSDRAIAFATAGTANERLRITSGGNVQVNGGAVHIDANGELAIFETDTNLAFTNSAKLALDYSGNIARIRSSHNGSGTTRNLGLYLGNSQKLLITSTEITAAVQLNLESAGSYIKSNQLKFNPSGHAYIDHGVVAKDISFRLSKSSSLDQTMLQMDADGEITKFHKVISVGLQGGNDTSVLGGGSGIGAYLQLNHASSGINTKLMGNADSYLNQFHGNLAIGEDDPAGNKLLIRAASTVGTNKGHIMLTGDSATNGQGPQIVFSESGSGSNFAGAYIGHIREGSNSTGSLVFGTRATSGDANTVPTERLRILSTGVIGINAGNYSALSSLDVRHHNGTAGNASGPSTVVTICAGRNSTRGLEIKTGRPTSGNQNDAAVYYNTKDTESGNYHAQHNWQNGGVTAMTLGYTGYEKRLGVGNLTPDGRNGSIDISCDDTTTWSPTGDQRGEASLTLRNPSANTNTFTAMHFLNGGGTASDTILASVRKGGMEADFHVMRRIDNAGSGNDNRASVTMRGLSTGPRVIIWAAGTGDNNGDQQCGNHIFESQQMPGYNQYVYWNFKIGSASYSRAGSLRYHCTWSTGHASGAGYQIGTVLWINNHNSGGTCDVREHLIYRRRYNGGHHYGWTSAPELEVFQSNNTGQNASIIFRCQGHGSHNSNTYDMTTVVHLHIEHMSVAQNSITPRLERFGTSSVSGTGSVVDGDRRGYCTFSDSEPTSTTTNF